MSFTVTEFLDLVRLLEQQPEWRAELRRLVLTDEVLALPQTIQSLATAEAADLARRLGAWLVLDGCAISPTESA